MCIRYGKRLHYIVKNSKIYLSGRVFGGGGGVYRAGGAYIWDVNWVSYLRTYIRGRLIYRGWTGWGVGVEVRPFYITLLIESRIWKADS